MLHSSHGALLWLAGGEVSGTIMRCRVLGAGYQTYWTSSQERVRAIVWIEEKHASHKRPDGDWQAKQDIIGSPRT
jgi:hypothetical protein